MLRLLVYLFDFIVVVILGRLLNRVMKSLFGVPPGQPGGSRTAQWRDQAPMASGQTARDPVCGMFVSTELSHRLTRGTETLHFCSQECLERFQRKAANV
jgi:YHS domain-containing protein